MNSNIFINEGSTSYHSIAIVDQNGALVVPQSLRYRLKASSIDIIQDWTSIPTDSTEIVVTPEQNTIGPAWKERFLTVEATYNNGQKITSEIGYTLVDLVGYP